MIDIKVPEAGESITEVELAQWLVEDGAWVEKDQEIAEIDSDKATLTINADQAGKIKISIEDGSTVEPGQVIGQIDPSAEKPKDSGQPKPDPEPSAKEEAPKEKAQPAQEESGSDEPHKKEPSGEPESTGAGAFTVSPQAQKLLDEQNISIEEITQNPDSKRVTKRDVLVAISQKAGQSDQPPAADAQPAPSSWSGSREEQKIKMTTLRKKVAQRLVSVKNDTAMLTTFNEVDMSALIQLRNKYKTPFLEKFGVKPGFMSFFAKAVTQSIPHFPHVNARIDEGHIIQPEYADIGIAVSTPKGLMVPVIRNAESKSLAELEQAIGELAKKARDNKISIEELTGGTFSITNGGVFGSMLSTPIINPPQSAILGMHNIVERPVAVDGKVEIKPIMYVALSYDHRIIDGKESVGFLVKVKEFLENPTSMLFPGKSPEETLLGL